MEVPLEHLSWTVYVDKMLILSHMKDVFEVAEFFPDSTVGRGSKGIWPCIPKHSVWKNKATVQV